MNIILLNSIQKIWRFENYMVSHILCLAPPTRSARPLTCNFIVEFEGFIRQSTLAWLMGIDGTNFS